MIFVVFFFEQKTAYEMRISDWSSDVCSSDLPSALAARSLRLHSALVGGSLTARRSVRSADLPLSCAAHVASSRKGSTSHDLNPQIGRASCRERVCQYV